VKLVVRRIEGDEDEARARDFAGADLLARALLHASLEETELRAHSAHWAALHAGRMVGLAARIDDVFRYRSVPVAATLPGVARELLAAIERPFAGLAAERIWPELRRCEGEKVHAYVQMVRLRRDPLGEPDPAVQSIDDHAELLAFLGPDFSGLRLKLGPFFGIRNERGALIAAGGVEFATGEIAQLAMIQTSEERRREGLGRAVVTELLRALEVPGRRIILQVREDNAGAIALYSSLGFRGTRRLAKFWFD
jgi:ribosomal protein S18 acetylase RimI-like enzyme